MIPPIRYLVVVFGILVCCIRRLVSSRTGHSRLQILQITLHFILVSSHEGYGRTTSLSRIVGSLRQDAGLQGQIPEKSHNTTFLLSARKANAVLVVLARNSDLKGVLESIKHMENTFNKRFQYPWVFLNEESFSEDFKKYVLVIYFRHDC